MSQNLTAAFRHFAGSAQAGALLLATATAIALLLANASTGATFLAFWHRPFAGLPLEVWINDGLMAVFFLLIGLELRRELTRGELSTRDRALLPVVAAIGGMAVPALVHATLNVGTPAARGFGIPMATDIAFTLAALGLLGRRIPPALRVFVVAFAVIDDLGAIGVIALFYGSAVDGRWLALALLSCGAAFVLNRAGRVTALWPYLLIGIGVWVAMRNSGLHATLAGVLLAFVLPAGGAGRLEHALDRPVALGILPLFALANAGVVLGTGWQALGHPNSLGIVLGLVVGKPVGIVLASLLACRVAGLRLPAGVGWAHLVGAGLLGGIGFTMSIFIAHLAFPGETALVNASKFAILAASLASALLGIAWLSRVPRTR